jgi:predicted MFS family arabinose efflux permease
LGARFISHKLALSIGTLLLVAVQVVLALAATPPLLLVAGVVWGVAQALCVVPVGPLITESVRRSERAVVFGRLYATWALATVVGSVLGGVLPGLLSDLFAVGSASGTTAYRAVLLITTVITLLSWPLLLLPFTAGTGDTSEAQVDSPEGHGWALGSVRRTAMGVVITIGLYSFAAGLVAPFMNVYFAQKLHLSTPVIGVLFGLAALLSVPGSLLGPRISRRLGSVTAVVLVRLAIFPCLLGLALGNLVPLLAMTGFLLRFALIFTAGALDSHFTLAAVPARSRPLLYGLRAGTFNLCWALGAWGAGQLIDRVGYPATFITSAILTAVASLLFLGLFGLPLRR